MFLQVDKACEAARRGLPSLLMDFKVPTYIYNAYYGLRCFIHYKINNNSSHIAQFCSNSNKSFQKLVSGTAKGETCTRSVSKGYVSYVARLCEGCEGCSILSGK